MLENYLTHLEQKGYSPNTLLGIKFSLRQFFAWLWQNFNLKPLDATAESLEKYALHVKETYGPNTRALKLSYVRGFYKFCLKKEYILRDLAQYLPSITRTSELLKDVPDESAILRILEEPDAHTYAGIRDKAILELLYSTGIRSQELRDLKVTDLDLKLKTVKVRKGKGGKGRMLPLGRAACYWMQKYLEVTRRRYLRRPEEDSLFLSCVTGKALGKSGFDQIIIRHRRAARFTKKISAHSFRHACALHMLRRGAPIESIQELLGHRRLSTTQIYTKLSVEDLKTMLQKHHPREKSYSKDSLVRYML